MKSFFSLSALLLLIGAPLVLFFLSGRPRIEWAAAPAALGAQSEISIRAEARYGVRLAAVRVEQGEARAQAQINAPADRFFFWRKRLTPATFALRVATGRAQGFRSGPARITAEVVSNDFRGQAATVALDTRIQLDPPRVTADRLQHYIHQGGAELVTFTVAGDWSEAGVRVGGVRFRSFRLPGAAHDTERFCLFAVPWDAPAGAEPLVYARNAAGEEATAPFWRRVFPQQFRRREIELTDAFLEKAVNELDPGGRGDLLQRFLGINGAMRRRNNETLASLRRQTEERFLWAPPFQQLSNSKVEAHFADVRTYVRQGRKVDEQVHLGFDLSKVRHAPVVASNSGKVVYADRLGIYGNCVVVDHGYGLQSIYGHLSSIAVRPGMMVRRGEELGRSGETGLAGGDHLHFSMQIDGVQVNPVEWWDEHWIHDRIVSKLPQSAFPIQ